MKPSYQQVPRTSAECKDNTGRPKQELHPFSLILLILWGSFTVGLLCLLHVAVTHGPGSAADNDNFHPSWALITLPTILLTVFTQAHVPITAFHLARIAVSALQNPNTTPNSWAELFWMADHEWMGPVGIVKTTFLSIRARTRASFTYILFATTCAVALVTPVLLSQAYQVQQVTVTAGREIRSDTVSFEAMSAENSTFLQLPVALASWETGFSVSEMYETSLFIPNDQPRDTAPRLQDYFFASDIGNASAILPGLQLRGNCAPLDVRNPVFSTDDWMTQLAFFVEYCASHVEPDSDPPDLRVAQNFSNFDSMLGLALCDRTQPVSGSNPDFASEMGFLLYQFDRPTGPSPVKAHGIIQCNSTLSAGTASISGIDHTYTNFTRKDVTISSGQLSGSLAVPMPLLDFVKSVAARPYENNSSDSSEDEDTSNGPILRGFGFQPYEADQDKALPPSPGNVSEGLWSGVMHLAAATATLYTRKQVFSASIPRNVALYTRNTPYAVSVYVMLTLWLALVAGATVWSYRRTFSGSLNSYIAAELIHRERFLLEDVPIGDAGDNDRLKAPFKALGLYSDMELVQELKRRRTT